MLDLLYSRYSIRNYSDRPVEADKIEKILEAALLSPSSKNRKPWEFIAVTDKATLKQLSAAKPTGSTFLADAALAIVVAGNTEKSDLWIEDCSIAAIIIHLTAHDLGLGSCWVQFRERSHDENTSSSTYIKDVLHLPNHLEVECIISIGYPVEGSKPKIKAKRSTEKITRI
jgi:nitroreductase